MAGNWIASRRLAAVSSIKDRALGRCREPNGQTARSNGVRRLVVLVAAACCAGCGPSSQLAHNGAGDARLTLSGAVSGLLAAPEWVTCGRSQGEARQTTWEANLWASTAGKQWAFDVAMPIAAYHGAGFYTFGPETMLFAKLTDRNSTSGAYTSQGEGSVTVTVAGDSKHLTVTATLTQEMYTSAGVQAQGPVVVVSGTIACP